MAKKLTPISVENARPRKNSAGQPIRTEIPDAGKPGLYLIVQPSGKKSWAVRYRHGGASKKVTLDGSVLLALARKQAQVYLDEIAEGRDPAERKKEAKRQEAEGHEEAFRAVAERFKASHLKHLKSGRPMARMLDMRWSTAGAPGRSATSPIKTPMLFSTPLSSGAAATAIVE